MSAVMWNIFDAKGGDDEELFAQFVDGPTPPVGENFTMMQDHRGPHPDGEILMVSGRVTKVDTVLFTGKSRASELHVSIYLDIKEMTKWDADKESTYSVEI